MTVSFGALRAAGVLVAPPDGAGLGGVGGIGDGPPGPARAPSRRRRRSFPGRFREHRSRAPRRPESRAASARRRSAFRSSPIHCRAQRSSRGMRHVEHDLAVLHVLLRNLDTGAACVDDEMRSEAVVDHPFVHRPDEIRTLLGRRRRAGYWRSSCSNSVRLALERGPARTPRPCSAGSAARSRAA